MSISHAKASQHGRLFGVSADAIQEVTHHWQHEWRQPADEQAAERAGDDDLEHAGRQRVLAPRHVLCAIGIADGVRRLHRIQRQRPQGGLHRGLFPDTPARELSNAEDTGS